jgi:AcrR family transcriptional regulator
LRITADAKRKTRRRILRAADELFAREGFERTTTRDIARVAGIAAGTLFNYFVSKEELAVSLLADGMERGREGFLARRRGDESLDEDLFAHVAAILRETEAHRALVGEVVGVSLSPFTGSGAGGQAEGVRTAHLETVAEVLNGHGTGAASETAVMHLYWTLFLGVLAFWSADDSPGQEDSMALLDRSMRMFAQSIRPGATGQEA